MWKIIFAICTLAAASSFADQGRFCNTQEDIIQWVCGYRPSGRGWVYQGGQCYHRNTGRYCPNPYGYDYPIRGGFFNSSNLQNQLDQNLDLELSE